MTYKTETKNRQQKLVLQLRNKHTIDNKYQRNWTMKIFVMRDILNTASRNFG